MTNCRKWSNLLIWGGGLGGPKRGFLGPPGGARNPGSGGAVHLIICQIGGDFADIALGDLYGGAPGAPGGGPPGPQFPGFRPPPPNPRKPQNRPFLPLRFSQFMAYDKSLSLQ